MAEKKATIVIKKITVVSGGGHGGAWKVAFADFMTAMMCFFLVMWLVSSSSDSDKKAVSDYFSTPSVIEYNFQNYGVEMTLEKLFLDLINEPLKTLESVMKPMDKNPDVMQMGMKKVAVAFLADQLGEVAKDVQVSQDRISFEIPDTILFQKGTAEPNAQFLSIMDKVKGITTGLENTDVVVTSLVYQTTVAHGDMDTAKNVAVQRLEMISKKVESSFESETNDVVGRAVVRKDASQAKTADGKIGNASGVIRFEMKQKDTVVDGRKPRPFKEEVFGKAGPDHSVYDNFVNQLSTKKKSAHKNEPNKESDTQ